MCVHMYDALTCLCSRAAPCGVGYSPARPSIRAAETRLNELDDAHRKVWRGMWRRAGSLHERERARDETNTTAPKQMLMAPCRGWRERVRGQHPVTGCCYHRAGANGPGQQQRDVTRSRSRGTLPSAPPVCETHTRTRESRWHQRISEQHDEQRNATALSRNPTASEQVPNMPIRTVPQPHYASYGSRTVAMTTRNRQHKAPATAAHGVCRHAAMPKERTRRRRRGGAVVVQVLVLVRCCAVVKPTRGAEQ